MAPQRCERFHLGHRPKLHGLLTVIGRVLTAAILGELHRVYDRRIGGIAHSNPGQFPLVGTALGGDSSGPDEAIAAWCIGGGWDGYPRSETQVR